MHEWSLCTALIKEAEAEARRRGAIRVTSIRVEAGALAAVVPELLERAYEVARAGTLLETAPLTIALSDGWEIVLTDLELEVPDAVGEEADGV